jgi:hypothetical protein
MKRCKNFPRLPLLPLTKLRPNRIFRIVQRLWPARSTCAADAVLAVSASGTVARSAVAPARTCTARPPAPSSASKFATFTFCPFRLASIFLYFAVSVSHLSTSRHPLHIPVTLHPNTAVNSSAILEHMKARLMSSSSYTKRLVICGLVVLSLEAHEGLMSNQCKHEDLYREKRSHGNISLAS